MNKKGFTLLELLVVVLIIGILASIALPQYQMAVTKAKVASILPIMRRWKDAMYEYKLQHGDYNFYGVTAGEYLGVTWPNDWKDGGNNDPCGDNGECMNDYWYCFANENTDGYLYCKHDIDRDNEYYFKISMYPSDYEDETRANKITCEWNGGDEAQKVCKALGSTLIEGDDSWGEYSLN